MDAVLPAARAVQSQLKILRTAIDGNRVSGEFSATLVGVSQLERALSSDFDSLVSAGRKRQAQHGTVEECRKLQRCLGESKNVAADLRGQIKQEQHATVSRHIKHLWYIRVGLSPPTMLATSLSQFLREWCVDESSQISDRYIGHVRNAFAELLKDINVAEIQAMVANAATEAATDFVSVICSHVQDESHMQVRSYKGGFAPGARSSKIQNHAFGVHTTKESCDLLTELQALQKKDGRTIATSIIQVMDRALKAVRDGLASSGKPDRALRVLHVITGDAINTNDNSYRRVYQHFSVVARTCGFKFFLIGIKCCSHQRNLVVVVAICGSGMKRPLDNDVLTANCSRLYKYLAADYYEEFAANLRDEVSRTTRFLPLDEASDPESLRCIEQSKKLVQLYGEGVFPKKLQSLLNRDITKLECFVGPDTDHAKVSQTSTLTSELPTSLSRALPLSLAPPPLTLFPSLPIACSLPPYSCFTTLRIWHFHHILPSTRPPLLPSTSPHSTPLPILIPPALQPSHSFPVSFTPFPPPSLPSHSVFLPHLSHSSSLTSELPTCLPRVLP